MTPWPSGWLPLWQLSIWVGSGVGGALAVYTFEGQSQYNVTHRGHRLAKQNRELMARSTETEHKKAIQHRTPDMWLVKATTGTVLYAVDFFWCGFCWGA